MRKREDGEDRCEDLGRVVHGGDAEEPRFGVVNEGLLWACYGYRIVSRRQDHVSRHFIVWSTVFMPGGMCMVEELVVCTVSCGRVGGSRSPAHLHRREHEFTCSGTASCWKLSIFEFFAHHVYQHFYRHTWNVKHSRAH